MGGAHESGASILPRTTVAIGAETSWDACMVDLAKRDEGSEAANEAAFEELIRHIASRLAGGTSVDTMVRELADQGIDEQNARQLVNDIDDQVVRQTVNSRPEIPSWLLYVGGLILINVILVAVDAPFFIY